MSDGKFPNPARSKMQSCPANKTFQKVTTPDTTLTKKLSSESPHSLVNSIYELKQTVYNLAQCVCNGGKSDRSTVAVSGGVRLRVIPAEPVDNAQDYLQGLQSRVQNLLHKIEIQARLIETTDTQGTKIILLLLLIYKHDASYSICAHSIRCFDVLAVTYHQFHMHISIEQKTQFRCTQTYRLPSNRIFLLVTCTIG